MQIASSVPLVRYWCSIDDTPIGKTSLAYADAFAGMGIAMRIIAIRMGALAQQAGDAKAPWHRHRSALLTPIQSSYVNVVCGTPNDWKRLYTVGVKNVLIVDRGPPSRDEQAVAMALPVPDPKTRTDEMVKLGHDELALEVALKYQVIIVPSEEISQQWQTLGASPLVIPMDLGRHALELKRALFS